MSQKAREEYEYYFPLYNLHQPLKIVKLGHGALQAFGNLPRQMRREFLLQWDLQQSEINQSVRSKKWFISNMKDCAILSVEVKSGNWTESIDQSARLAKESISILSFLYRAHFSVDEARFLAANVLKEEDEWSQVPLAPIATIKIEKC